MSNSYLDIEKTIDDYISNKLSENDCLAFEDYFASRPELSNQINDRLNMKMGLSELTDTQIASLGNDKTTSKFSLKTLINWIAVPVPAYVPLALLISVGVFFQRFELASLNSQNPELISFSTDVLRDLNEPNSGAVEKIQFELRDNRKSQFVLIKIYQQDLPNSIETYQAIITSIDSDEEIWRSSELELNSLKQLFIKLPDYLENMAVELEIKSMSKSDENIRFCNYSEPCK